MSRTKNPTSLVHVRGTKVRGKSFDETMARNTRSGAAPLSVSHPALAAEWHHSKNGVNTPDDFTYGSQEYAWWECSDGHAWKTRIGDRTQHKTGCPYCAGRLASPTNNLKVLFPRIAAQWHKNLNGKLRPEKVLSKSKKKVWWQCTEHKAHVWAASIANRTHNKSDCPYCSGHLCSEENSLATRFPEIAGEWHPTKNGKLKPTQFSYGSGVSIWWRCPKGPDHLWKSPIQERTRTGMGCPFCSSRKVSKTNSLQTIRPDLAKEWHPTLNGDLRPDEVTSQSQQKVWWQCRNDSSHEWHARVQERTLNKSRSCPYCSRQAASNDYNLKKCYPSIAAQWHYVLNTPMRPEHFVPKSHQIVWWKCERDRTHVWKAQIKRRTNQGVGCLYCAGYLASASNCLATKRPVLVEEWHPTKNGDLTPNDVTAGTHKEVWWQCKNDPTHEWLASVHQRTRPVVSHCPLCKGQNKRK